MLLMASKVESEANGCTFEWKIVNINHSWKTCGERIESLAFIADTLEGTKWSLWLYPKGKGHESFVDVYLKRENDCNGPEAIEIKHQIAFLDKDGKFLNKGNPYTDIFMRDGSNFIGYEKREKIFVTEREAYLPENTLTLQCTLWKKEETFVKSKHMYARTIFTLDCRSFVCKINDFSTLKEDARNKFFRDDVIDTDLVLKEGIDMEKKLVIEGIICDKSIKYLSFKTAVFNSEGKKEYCESHEYLEDDLKKGRLAIPLFTGMLLENKERYLPNDTLSVDFEYAYSSGAVSYQFCSSGIISPKLMNGLADENKEQNAEQSNTQPTPALANDLKSMLSDGFFSDIQLRTSTQTFSAHKNVLSARSPVFRKMFSSDMKEKNSGHVDIKDFDDDTVQRMLMYVYTDGLEVLQVENACKLYTAADKYEILSLRSKCSSFLKDNMCPNKACDILVVADMHQDDDLKSVVQDYIINHAKEVFGSKEWKHFMDTNPKLAADTMFRKVFSD